MKKIILVLVFGIILLSAASAYSFDLFGMFRSNPRTGDKQLDATLGNLDVQANLDKDGFISDLSLSYGVPKNDIQNLLNNLKMRPSDVYMTLKLAQLLRKPLDFITARYKVDKGKGWGVIAKELGIKPGSAAFHALKQDADNKLELAKERNKQKTQHVKNKSRHVIKDTTEGKPGKGKNK